MCSEAGAHSVWPATGPAPAAGGAAGLVLDPAVGKCLLQVGEPRGGDLAALEILTSNLRLEGPQSETRNVVVGAVECT